MKRHFFAVFGGNSLKRERKMSFGTKWVEKEAKIKIIRITVRR